MKIKVICCLSLLMLIASFATAQDSKVPTGLPCGPTITPSPTLFVNWPKFQFDLGNTGCNPYEFILSPATVGNLVLKWKYTTGSPVGRSPAVSMAWSTSGLVTDNNVYALKASTGALQWKYTTGREVESSPAVANGMVYVGS